MGHARTRLTPLSPPQPAELRFFTNEDTFLTLFRAVSGFLAAPSADASAAHVALQTFDLISSRPALVQDTTLRERQEYAARLHDTGARRCAVHVLQWSFARCS